MYICICLYTHIFTYIHICICIYVYVYIFIYLFKYMCVCVCLCVYMSNTIKLILHLAGFLVRFLGLLQKHSHEKALSKKSRQLEPMDTNKKMEKFQIDIVDVIFVYICCSL